MGCLSQGIRKRLELRSGGTAPVCLNCFRHPFNSTAPFVFHLQPDPFKMADETSNISPRSSPSDDDMALVANPQALLQSGINKRYRPAPAKTFQCRGYGECRMVFSRSEHLARHIRSAHLNV